MSVAIDAMPPPRQGKRYRLIVARGCGVRTIETMDGTDYDCDFYEWECDGCPVVLEQERLKLIEGGQKEFKP